MQRNDKPIRITDIKAIRLAKKHALKESRSAANTDSFGSRLRKLRKDKGLSQERLRFLRKKRDFSQAEFAKKLGLNGHTQVSRYENGKSYPDVATLAKIAEVLDADLHWLITGQPSPVESTEIENYKEAVRRLLPYAENFLSNILRKREQPKSAVSPMRLHEEQEVLKDLRYEYKDHLKNLSDILRLVEPKAKKCDIKIKCDSIMQDNAEYYSIL